MNRVSSMYIEAAMQSCVNVDIRDEIGARELGKKNDSRKELRTRYASARRISIQAIFGKILDEYNSFLNSVSLAFCTVKNKNSTCHYYGHVTERRWVGLYPKCTDCGVQVKDIKMVRSAQLNLAA